MREAPTEQEKHLSNMVSKADKFFERVPLGEETCRGCGERVQVVQIISKHDVFPNTEQRIGCKCQEREIVRQVEVQNQQAHQDNVKRVFAEYSVVPQPLRGARLGNYEANTVDQRRVLQMAKDYVESFDPHKADSLLFMGKYGVGKSRLAYSITAELTKRGYASIFIRVNDLLRKLKDSYRKDAEVTENSLLRELEKADLVALDDLGTEYKGRDSAESWAVSKIYDVIDARTGRATIYTTNLGYGSREKDTSDELYKALGGRIFSRMQENLRAVKFRGKDYRAERMRGVSE